MSKTFEQTEKTKNFIREVKNLVESGIEPSYKVVADKLTWNNNALSQVISGTRNVPADVYRRFEEVYNNTQEITQAYTAVPIDYKDRYIALLEQQLHEKTRRLDVLEEKVVNYLNSSKLEAYLQSLLALARTQMDVTLQAQARSEKKDLKKLKESVSTLFDEHLAVIEGGGSSYF